MLGDDLFENALCVTLNLMKKICLFLIGLTILTPVLVFADSYDGPYCFEPKSYTNADAPDPNGIRGTCKEIQVKDIVTLDPALQKDYFIGTHDAIGYGDCYRGGCDSYTKYSEQLVIYSSSTAVISSEDPTGVPTEAAVFDKSFFLPLLTNQFKQNHLNFSASDFPPITIDVIDSHEVSSSEITSQNEMDVLNSNYFLSTLNYQEYGKYIWGPTSSIVESQYVDLYKNDGVSTEKDLGISYTNVESSNIPIVSPVDPLNSVTNYWIYTQKDNKLALVWQKTDYGLDDGSIKTITPNNDNFGVLATVAPTTTPSSSIAQTPTPASVGGNIFQRVWNFILSWFR